MIIHGEARSSNFSPLDPKRRHIVSAMCVPLQARGVVLGTVNLNRTASARGAFTQRDLESMAVIASQAAISIENSRLHEANLKSERLAAIGQTVAGLAHCIKNVLTSLKGGLSLAESAGRKRDWELSDKGLEILGRSVHRVSALAMDMLSYSKERSCKLAKVDLAALAEEVAAMTRDQANEKNNAVIIDLAENARLIQADYDQLFRCILNLVGNSLDANDSGGRVIISSKREDTPEARHCLADPHGIPVVIRIADTGPGIDEEHRAKLFEPFFSTKGSRGTGLGLAVTKKIIQEHGGTLELASKPGESAVFAIYLGGFAAD
jgi:signal transduction histidine kinase